MSCRIAFVTNAKEYAGAPAAAALAELGWEIFCHDESFASRATREFYEQENPRRYAAASQTLPAFVVEGLARFGRIDALVSNDPATGSKPLTAPTDDAPVKSVDLLDDFEPFVDRLAFAPVRLLRAALPSMKAAKSGSIVLVTSGVPLRVPALEMPHGYAAARAATNMLAKTLAVELAPDNIQVNAVAPFLVYSQTSFPSEIGAEDPKYAALVNRLVPMQRFGAPSEIGALIAHLASGEMSFISGQVIAFSGAGC